MSAGEKIANALHWAGNRIHSPNPNKGDRAVVQPLPAVDFRPVNEPGSTQPMKNNCWYRLIGSAGQDIGLMWLCGCGQSTPFLASPRYNLYRELEKDHHCSAGCADIIYEYATDEHGRTQLANVKQKWNTVKDERGEDVAVGRRIGLLDILPERGKHMSEAERDKIYSTLPTWRLLQNNQSSPFVSTWSQDTNSPVWEGIEWGGGTISDRQRRCEETGDPDTHGLF